MEEGKKRRENKETKEIRGKGKEGRVKEVNKYTYIRICVHIRVRICIYSCVRVYVCIYISYMYTCI